MVELVVIMPCFNGPLEYIQGAVESVKSERTSLISLNVILTLLIVDDASENKDILPFLDELDKQYTWLSLLRLPYNVGCSAARKTALKHSNSEWVTFLDTDDYWLPGGVTALCAEMLKDRSVEWVSGDFFIKKGSEPVTDKSFYPQVPSRLQYVQAAYDTKSSIRLARPVAAFLEGSLCSMGACVITRDALQRAGGFHGELRKGDDTELYWRLAKEVDLVFLPKEIFVYRRYDGTVSSDGRHLSDWEPEHLSKMLLNSDWSPYKYHVKRRLIRTLMNLSVVAADEGYWLKSIAFSFKAVTLKPYGIIVWKRLMKNIFRCLFQSWKGC